MRSASLRASLLLLLIAGSAIAAPAPARKTAPARKATMNESHANATATLSGGCFWCVEAVLERLEGVSRVVSGYTGGRVPNPTYQQVCTGTTGHAEAVQVTFDPAVISYRELLEVFMAFHDPTTLNRQGADVGTQYRSAIFYASPEQQAAAEQTIADLTRRHVFPDPIVTKVEPLGAFYPAEDYHQNYYRENSGQPYCQAVIAPKVSKLRAKYAARLKPSEAEMR